MSQWWKGALIYQIYPRSFKDSNNDGVGDLRGITEKLGYIASLGVDAIWISPFFKSPMKDFGYDISDYRSVDAMFGDIDDFKSLLKQAHQKKLKVIIDQVISHSSDQHEWFKESRTSKHNSKADWYVWADPKPDGSAPNNWLSFFGGSAWTFDETRQQYYLHNFLTSQPDLNFHNPAVQKAQLDNLRFWLDLGVDGFRLDVANFFFHDAQLRDNPMLADNEDTTVGVAAVNPYSKQRHIYDISQPENITFIEKLRSLMDEYPGTTTMGELNGENALELMADYTRGNTRLHMAYTFDLLSEDASNQHILSVVRKLESASSQGWPCWALGNHDVVRVASRWGANKDPEHFSLAAMAMLISLHGSVCIYQGDELGLEEAEVDFDDIVDPYGKPFWPEYKGRDGCRTPFPWSGEVGGGFSKAKPWLPLDVKHVNRSADAQQQQSNSVLNRTRQLIHWRQSHQPLVKGTLEVLDTKDNALCWIREWEGERILVVVNLAASELVLKAPLQLKEPLTGHGFNAQVSDSYITLPPYQVFYSYC